MKDSVQPPAWVLPSRIHFAEWIYQTFHPSHYDATGRQGRQGRHGAVESSPHQKLIRDLLTEASPYRGLLLYHGLGVGKTRSSILAAEDFIRHRKKIVVMLPASLQKNYRNEILLSSSVGRLQWRHWRKITLDLTQPEQLAIYLSLQEEFPIGDDFAKKYTVKSTQQTVFWIPYIPEGLTIPDRFLSPAAAWDALTPKDHKTVAGIHEYFIAHTYEFVNYNGLLKSHLTTKYKSDFFENKFVIIDEAHNFITQSMKEENILAKLYQRLMNAKNVRLLLLSGTPVINRPLELAYTISLLRGPVPTATYDFGKRPLPASEDDLWATFHRTAFPGVAGVSLGDIIDTAAFSTNPKEKTVELTLLPYGFARVGAAGTGTGAEIKHHPELAEVSPEVYKTRINQAMEGAFHVLKTKHRWETHLALPDNEKTFQELFLRTGNDGAPEIHNQRLFIQRSLGLVSYYKVNTKLFPRMNPVIVRRVPLSEHQFMSYLHNRHDEQNMERKKKLRAIRRGGVVEDDGNNVYRTFSRMACNFVFPKAIPRHFPMSIRAAMREMDDAGAAAGVEDMEKKVEETYERERRAAMEALEAGAANYLTEEALRANYSPKMAQMLADLATNPGKGLFYSQFREMEGMGIFALALRAAGWCPLDIRLREGGTTYEFVNPDEVFQAKYNRRRYVVFNQDRTRSDILLKLFNGSAEWTQVPKEAAGLVKEVQRRGFQDNLRGELAALMMISQSGAEGISLKEVRQVYILEPFWNQVRIDQVIGRASRTNSHAKLPPAEREVQVFMYVATFTPAQIEKDHTMRHLDHEQTSDEHILQIAQRKKHVIEQFENALKMAAVDCLNNAGNNQTRADGLQCYMPPTDFSKPGAPGAGAAGDMDQLQYVPDIQDHLKLLEKQAKRIRRTKVQGKRKGDGVRIPRDRRRRLYDAEAYENAAALVPMPPKA